MSMIKLKRTRGSMKWIRTLGIGVIALMVGTGIGGTVWWQSRYDNAPEQIVPLTAFGNEEYPENPEDRGARFGNYPHRSLKIEQLGDTRFRFVIEPGSTHSTTIELPEVDLAHFVAAIPPWVTSDPELTKVGLIDREWNRQQVQFRRSPYMKVHDGGDGFEQRAVTRVDLARNCLNAGLWELLLFTTEEDGVERVYEHVWFTFPLGLYKELFERVNDLSYWEYWWSLEHWVDPAGTSIRLDGIRTVEREWPIKVDTRWDERPVARGEQVFKRKNILAGPIHTYRDWYDQEIQFSSFIPPGRYSLAHPRETKLHSLAEVTEAVLRRVRMEAHPQPLMEIELTFRDSKTGELSRLIFGGLDLAALPAATPDRYQQGWQAPMGIANPGFFETYEHLVAVPPAQRTFYGFHLDADDRWIDHHAIGVDGPLLHWDEHNPGELHLYLLSYERHALLNHFVLPCPADRCQRQRL